MNSRSSSSPNGDRRQGHPRASAAISFDRRDCNRFDPSCASSASLSEATLRGKGKQRHGKVVRKHGKEGGAYV